MDDLPALCRDLHQAGIWLQRTRDGGLQAGPGHVLRAQPALLAALKAQKPQLLALIEASLAAGILGDDAPPVCALTADCPACDQRVYVHEAPRRLALHRLTDGKTLCPDAVREQVHAARAILEPFLQARTVPRPAALCTWTALHGALQAYCREQQLTPPPAPYLQDWLSQRYERRRDTPTGPVWKGLAVTVEEWLGEGDGEGEALAPPQEDPQPELPLGGGRLKV